MEPFRDVLAVGGHRNSLGRSGELVELLGNNPARVKELFACLSDDDAWVRMRAVDAFEKVVAARPKVGLPFVDRILGELTHREQPSVQWHVAQLLAELDLTASQRRRAIAWLQQRIATTDVDWIVASNTMKTLLGFGRSGHGEAAELRPLFQVQTGHPSAAVRRNAGKALLQLG
jgi:HEAT repeat protein